MSKVVGIGRDPVHVRPEMIVRWLMSEMDQIDQIVVLVKKKGASPIVSVSDGASPYFIAMGAALLQDLALDKIEPKAPDERPSA